MILVYYSWRHSCRTENFIISESRLRNSLRHVTHDILWRRWWVQNIRRRNDNFVLSTYLMCTSLLMIWTIYTCPALDTNVTGTTGNGISDGRSIVHFRRCHYDEYTRCRKEFKESRAEFLSFTSCVTHTESLGGLSHRAGKNFRRVTLQLQFLSPCDMSGIIIPMSCTRFLLVFVCEILNFPSGARMPALSYWNREY